MKRRMLVAAMAVIAGLAMTSSGRTVFSHDREDGDESRVRRGFAISPVKLTFHSRNREWVGFGSYIVNAQGACNDCHTCPSYAKGGNPYAHQQDQLPGQGRAVWSVHHLRAVYEFLRAIPHEPGECAGPGEPTP